MSLVHSEMKLWKAKQKGQKSRLKHAKELQKMIDKNRELLSVRYEKENPTKG